MVPANHISALSPFCKENGTLYTLHHNVGRRLNATKKVDTPRQEKMEVSHPLQGRRVDAERKKKILPTFS